MRINGFGRPAVPADDAANLRGPMPWLSRRRSGAPYRLPGLQYPLGSLIHGLVSIALGIVALVATAAASSAALAAGVPLFLIAAGLGLWMVIAAAVRWPRYRQYKHDHGHAPF